MKNTVHMLSSFATMRHIRRILISFLLLVPLMLFDKAVFAQQFTPFAVPTPGGFLDSVYDYLGHSYALGEVAIDDRVRVAAKGGGAPMASLSMSTCGSGYFQIYMDPGSGFDGTYPAAVTRMNVLCQVLSDLSDFIHSPLPTSGGKVNIWVRKMGDVTGGGTPFAAVASSFFCVPFSSTASGIADNTMWLTINSGIDAYTNVTSPLNIAGGTASSGGSFFHGMVAIDTTLSWQTNLGDTTHAGSRDLYTVLLHEVMHALGFATLIDYNGTSRLGPSHKYYSRYDQYLYTHGGTRLLSDSGSCSLYNWKFNPAITSPSSVLSPGGGGVCPLGYDTTTTFIDSTTCITAIEYRDGIITNQPVFNSPCYVRGSSLSHFEDKCYVPGSFVPSPPASNDQYFVMSNRNIIGPYSASTNPGAMKRYLKPEERQVLCDIGYNVDTLFGDIARHNFHNYSGGICPGIDVVGINDGLDTGGVYIFSTAPGVPVAINGGASSILDNDYQADSFSCLETVIGSGTFTATSGTSGTLVSYTPTTGSWGLQLLRYLPHDSSGWVTGNITYIYVYVGDTSCVTTACNLVSNGSFENAPDSVGGDLALNPNLLHCWRAFNGTPDLDSRWGFGFSVPMTWAAPDVDTHYLSSTPNNKFLEMGCRTNDSTTHSYWHEGAQNSLGTPMLTGSQYVISCWARMCRWSSSFSPAGYSYLPSYIQFSVSPATTPTAPLGDAITALPTGYTQIWKIKVDTFGNQWHFYTDTFTYTGPPANTLAVMHAAYLNPYASTGWMYAFVDDVSIMPLSSSSTFTLPDTMCSSDPLLDLSTLVSIGGGTFSWQSFGTGVFTSHDTMFNPDLALWASMVMGTGGIVTVSYTYTSPLGCSQTIAKHTYIKLGPDPITGPSVLCHGDTATLFETYPPGGIWTSSTTGVAAVAATSSLTGLVTAVSSGTATIFYTIPNGCAATHAMTVNPIPTSVTGTLHVCVGATTVLGSPTPGGAWISGNTAVATIDTFTGMVTGMTPGTTTITYGFGTGCSTSVTFTVNPLPAAITGTASVCVGMTTTLSDASLGGTWSSSDIMVATVGLSSGIVTGGSAGTATITYMLASGCFVTQTVTVYPLPDAITGTFSICEGDITTLSSTTTGGTWSSSNTSVADIVTGLGTMSGISGGTAVITYMLGTGCYITQSVVVNDTPLVISGITHVCTGLTTTLSNSATGGTWSSSAPLIATVGISTGIVTGEAPGTAIISYALGGGCFATIEITVNPLPEAITGTFVMCQGDSTVLADATAGGTWSSSSAGVADINAATGMVTGISGGTASITYTLSTGCIATAVITVNPLPSAISGSGDVCEGVTATLASATGGGSWSSSDPSVATIDIGSGAVTGVMTGTAIITYSLGTGCFVTFTMTVHPLPTPIVAATFVICEGDNVSLSSTPSGGTWSSSASAIASVSSGGLVTGVSGGSANIIYTLGTGCYTWAGVTVNPMPAPITGTFTVCTGSTTTLSDAVAGATWTSSDPAIASVGSGTGIVTGILAGSSVITYGFGTGCEVTATVDVFPTPAPIPQDTVCVGGSITLTNSLAGGDFSTDPMYYSIITVDISGFVTGMSAGTAVVSYTMPSGCYVTTTVVASVGPYIPPITGFDTVCIASTDTLFDALTGGTWSSGSPTATVDAVTGEVTGVSTGTAVITYSATDACGTSYITRAIWVGTPPVAPITGILGVCSGDSTTLYDAAPGGTWSMGGSALIATVNPVTGVVSGMASGSVTISYTVSNSCGSTVATVNVLVNMEPFITTNTIVACQTLGDPGGRKTVISSSGVCIKVCDSSTVRYYANGVAGSVFTWAVAGGTVVADYGDSIDVFWTTVGLTGTLTLYDTFSHCIGEAGACIKVISKPNTLFSTSAITYCLKDKVIFTNLSSADTASPILHWYWDFGDGHASTVENPDHTYSTAGIYTVTLVAANQCNCTDTFRVVIEIQKNPGPHIECPSIVCKGETAKYSISERCHTYDWSVDGGTIVSGWGTSKIEILWDDPNADGFGIVKASVPCAKCSDTTSIKVPIIFDSAAIDGRTVVCVGEQYQYSLPLWAATEYTWGVLGSPGSVVGCRKDHKVVLQFSTPGTYTLHGWYQNRIKLCGGNVYKTITVIDTSGITGATEVCINTTAGYSVGGGAFTADWTLTDMATGTVVTTLSSSTSFPYTFLSPGVYLLSANGDFCADPLTISVPGFNAAIASLTGKDTVCLNRSYTYKAWNDIPGAIYQWEAVGGTVTPASGSNLVTVVWTSYGPKELRVSHVSTTPPYCSGPQTLVSITQEIIDPLVSGESAPCANSSYIYDAGYTRGEAYDWSVFPDSAGSITGGVHGIAATVLWSNVSAVTTAAVIVKASKCDTTVTDTLWVNVQPVPPIAITPVIDTVCPVTPVTFTASPGDSAYVWNFGDGTGIVVTTTNTVTHSFPENTGTTSIFYTVKVTPVFGVGIGWGCQPSGIGIYLMPVKPGPVAYASSATTDLCTGSINLIGTVTSNVGGLVYQWYKNGSMLPSAVTATYMATDSARYFFTVTASNGCSGTSNTIKLTEQCGAGGGCELDFTASTTHYCNTITLYGGAGPAGAFGEHWTALEPPVSGTGLFPPTYSTVASATYDLPGIYNFQYFMSSPTCSLKHIVKTDTIPLVVRFRYQVGCGPSGMDTLFLSDYTTHLPFYTIDSVRWEDVWAGITIGTGTNASVVLAAAASIAITETVYFTGPGGSDSCKLTRVITAPAPPVADFISSYLDICESVPVTFTPLVSGDIVNFYWSFGDDATSILSPTMRTYTWQAGLPTQIFMVTLTVTDTFGCTADIVKTVDVRPNLLNGHLGVSSESFCSSSVPVSLNWINTGLSTPISFEWSTGAITSIGTTTVSASGAYWVTVYDAYQCQRTRPSPITKKISIITPPVPHIKGDRSYCYGEQVQLSGYIGTGVSYEWFRNGTPISTASEIVNSGLHPGGYEYLLVIGATDSVSGVICYDSVADSVHIRPLPAPPSIIGPNVVDCDKYQFELVATASVSGTYNWSDGRPGPIDSVSRGGPYRVWFTDLYGCASSTDVFVPYSPGKYFPYLPSGCYEICEDQLPLRLYGPPCTSFSSWAWVDGVTDPSGIGAMPPYTVTGGGTLAWKLNTGLCSQTSDEMTISTRNCSQCNPANLTASLTCDTSNPASYDIVITFDNYVAGTTYTLGTELGPVLPYSGVLGTVGSYTLTPLTFTTMTTSPLPASVTVVLILTDPYGNKCYFKKTVALPPCSWIAQRGIGNSDTAKGNIRVLQASGNSMVVAPNPASGDLSVFYDYGNEGGSARILSVYDALGRRMGYSVPETGKGMWKVNTLNWAAGLYIVRMEGDGKMLQTQRVIVIH